MRFVSAALMPRTIAVGCNVDPLSSNIQAVRTIIAIRQTETHFHSQNGRYGSLWELAWADLIPASLGKGRSYDYQFEVELVGSTYTIRAQPADREGRRSFFLDQSGVIHESWDPTVRADATSPVLGSTHQ
jgi:hypothetical protein